MNAGWEQSFQEINEGTTVSVEVANSEELRYVRVCKEERMECNEIF